MFEETLKRALIDTYCSEYGEDTWNRKTDTEKAETLHELLCSFLTVAKKTRA